MIYQLWRAPDGEILIVNPRTVNGQKRARKLEDQGSDFVGTVESDLSPDTLQNGIAKKQIDFGMEAAGLCKRLGAKIAEANAFAVQMTQGLEGKARHDKR